MRARDDRAGSTRWILLAGLLVLSGASLAVLDGDSDTTPGHLLIGDLKLADSDEAPSDHVTRTFTARNLAPGDAAGGTLILLREPVDERLPQGLEPRVAIEVEEETPGELDEHLHVTMLVYGDRSLKEQTSQSCGRPLTLERLIACTQRPRHPLSNLPDPTPEGRDLILETRLPAFTGNEAQGLTTAFSVTVTLKGQASKAPVLEPVGRPISPPGCNAQGPLELGPGLARPLSAGDASTGGPPEELRLWRGGPWQAVLLEASVSPCRAAG